MKSLVVSFHDLHPGTRSSCEQFLPMARRLGVTRCSLLVVPRWHGGSDLRNDPAFGEWLQERSREGHEVCLHGLDHAAQRPSAPFLHRAIQRFYTAGEGEFLGADRRTAARKLLTGLTVLRGIGLAPVGFTAPAWLMSDGTLEALRDTGFAYAASFAGIHLPASGAFLSAPVVTLSTRTRWRRAVSIPWALFWRAANRNADVLRLAVHPGDVHDPFLRSLWSSLIRRSLSEGRTPATYLDVAVRAMRPGTRYEVLPLPPCYRRA